jgi:hypothetical protein
VNAINKEYFRARSRERLAKQQKAQQQQLQQHTSTAATGSSAARSSRASSSTSSRSHSNSNSNSTSTNQAVTAAAVTAGDLPHKNPAPAHVRITSADEFQEWDRQLMLRYICYIILYYINIEVFVYRSRLSMHITLHAASNRTFTESRARSSSQLLQRSNVPVSSHVRYWQRAT